MSLTLQAFKQHLSNFGLEWFNRYYGTYAGVVHDNEDPEFSGRLMLKVPQLMGDSYHDYWAPARGMPSGDGLGLWMLPNKGDKVWVTFENGDIRFPIWEYGPFTKAAVPKSANGGSPNPAKVVVLQSTQGYRLVLDEIKKEIRLETEGGVPQPIVNGQDWVQLMQEFLVAIGTIGAVPVASGVTSTLSSSPVFASLLAQWPNKWPTVLSKTTKAV